ncbi:recombinase family protein [Streptomyces sp. NPDC058657]|uniref:recombinase family protein n=1 Tax=unclassified Streptomyces TaxID=2593676 RepID=UPI003663535E
MPIAPEHLHLAYEGPFYAYLYGRASRDPSKEGTSVTSQLVEGRTLCDSLGWPIVREFPEIDRSASRYAKKTRELYEEMLEGIENGVPRILVAFEASRYYRDLDAYVKLRNACMTAGVLLYYDGAVYDLSKRADRKATALDAVNAEDEADGIQLRNARTTRQNAAAGGAHGRILWGYMRRYDADTGKLIGQFPHPERADAVKYAFTSFLGGKTIHSIYRHLAATRDAAVDGRAWEYYHVYEMLRNPSYAGRRVWQGRDYTQAKWDGIVEYEDFKAVQAILDSEDRASVDWSVQHELAGIARCGKCPAPVPEGAPGVRSSQSDGEDVYLCAAKADVSIRAKKLEAYVEEAVVEWLASKAPAAAFDAGKEQSKADAARKRHEALTRQLREARESASTIADDGTPGISVSSLAAIEARLQPLINKAQADIDSVRAVPPLLQGLIGKPREVVEAAWDRLDIEQRRVIYRATVNVYVNPAPVRGRRGIDPGRVTLRFVGEPGFIREWRRVRGLATVPAQKGKGPARERA